MSNMNVNYKCQLWISTMHVFVFQGGDIGRSKSFHILFHLPMHCFCWQALWYLNRPGRLFDHRILFRGQQVRIPWSRSHHQGKPISDTISYVITSRGLYWWWDKVRKWLLEPFVDHIFTDWGHNQYIRSLPGPALRFLSVCFTIIYLRT